MKLQTGEVVYLNSIYYQGLCSIKKQEDDLRTTFTVKRDKFGLFRNSWYYDEVHLALNNNDPRVLKIDHSAGPVAILSAIQRIGL